MSVNLGSRERGRTAREGVYQSPRAPRGVGLSTLSPKTPSCMSTAIPSGCAWLILHNCELSILRPSLVLLLQARPLANQRPQGHCPGERNGSWVETLFVVARLVIELAG